MASHVSLQDRIQDVFDQFFSVVAQKYGLSKEKVKQACLNRPVVKVSPLNKKDSQLLEEAKRFIVDEIPSMKMTVDKLKALCRDKGLKVSGKKEELLNRIQHPDNPEHKGGKTGGKKKNTRFKGCDASKIIDKLQGPASKLAIRKNAEGQYVHIDTGLVFHPQSQKVVGRWVDGKVRFLLVEDIELCKKLKVNFEIPENLDLGVIKIVDKTVTEALGEDDFKDDPDEEEEDDAEDDGDDPFNVD